MTTIKIVIYSILLLLSNANIQAQKYEFDLLTKYSIKSRSNEKETVIYSNSKNPNYVLYIFKKSSKREGKLYDIDKKKLHIYDVIETNDNGQIYFQFKYTNSNDFNSGNRSKEYELKTKSISKIDSIYKEIKIELLHKSNKTKKMISFTLKTKKTDSNLFPVFRFSCMHPFEFDENINVLENILVENASSLSFSGIKTNYKLLLVQEIKFELVIP